VLFRAPEGLYGYNRGSVMPIFFFETNLLVALFYQYLLSTEPVYFALPSVIEVNK